MQSEPQSVSGKALLFLGVSVVLIGLYLVVYQVRRAREKEQQKNPPPLVSVVQLAPGNIEETVTLFSTLEAWARAQLRPGGAGGRIEELRIEVGDRVRGPHDGAPGQILARLDHDELDAQLAAANGALEAAEAHATQLATQSEQAGRDRDRLVRLTEEGAVAAQALDQAKSQAAALEQALAGANAAAKQALGARDACTAALAETFVRAPFDGVILSRNYDIGELVGPASPIPLFEIADASRLKLYLHLPEQHLGRLANRFDAGERRALFTADAFPDATFTAEITRINPAVDELTRTIEVELAVGAAADGLRPGLSARVRLPIESRRNTLVVPAESVVRDGKLRYVFLLDERPAATPAASAAPAGPRARRVPVRLGLRSGGQVEVVEGLRFGDRLIVRGQHQLTDDVAVEVVPLPSSEAAATPRP